MDNTTKQILEIVTGIQEQMATKDDIKFMATKDDIKFMATKDDIKFMATKDDIKFMATKDDIKFMATKDDINSVKNEIEEMRMEFQKQISENTKAKVELSEQIRNVLGYAKEIDMLMVRVSVIEKHIGIK